MKTYAIWTEHVRRSWPMLAWNVDGDWRFVGRLYPEPRSFWKYRTIALPRQRIP